MGGGGYGEGRIDEGGKCKMIDIVYVGRGRVATQTVDCGKGVHTDKARQGGRCHCQVTSERVLTQTVHCWERASIDCVLQGERSLCQVTAESVLTQ